LEQARLHAATLPKRPPIYQHPSDIARRPLLVTVGKQRRDDFGSIADLGDPDERTSVFGSPLMIAAAWQNGC
jgi:hypothetical protein